jgi:hypothetical protein
MYLKLGKRYADVVCTSILRGTERWNDELVINTLWYGCKEEERVSAEPNVNISYAWA